MKRLDSNEQTDTWAKRQKLELEMSGSTSETIQQEDHDDKYIDGVAEVTGTASTDEGDLETDGEKDLGTACKIFKSVVGSGNNTRPRLEPGFGFEKDTVKYRIHTCEHSKARNDQPTKKATNVSALNHVEENIILPANSISRKSPIESQKKHEPDWENTNNTDYKTNDQCETNSENELETPETDVIYTRQLEEWKLPNIPIQVPTNYADMSPKNLPTIKKPIICGIQLNKKKPDQRSKILIPHKYADKPEGDDFGATLCTYIDQLKYGQIYYRHFFKKVEPNQPASDMEIKDDDELVLLNDVFVPALVHTDVLNLFHHVKVDGKTKFALVIRRKLSEQKWDWIETSAVLAPEKEKDSPAVTDLKYEVLEGDRTIYRPISKHLYQVPGTQKYIDIHDGKVRIGTMNDRNKTTKIIWKCTKFWQEDTEGHIDFASTLCDLTKKWYIAIDVKDQIVVQIEPVWFKMIKTGSKIRFQFHKLYLGYDLEDDTLKAQVTDCLFEELPVPSADTVDNESASQAVDPLTAEGKNNFEQPPRTLSLNTNIGPSTTGINTTKGNDASPMSSADSGINEFDLEHRSRSGTDNGEHPACISSQSSLTSGYRSATPENMDINTPNESGIKVSTQGFPWYPKLAHIGTPTTPMKKLDLSDSEVD